MRMIDNIANYVKDLTEMVWSFINHRERFPKEAQLCVQPELMVNVIDDPRKCRYCDVYDLKMLIHENPNGKMVPNQGAIERVAQRYYSQVG